MDNSLLKRHASQIEIGDKLNKTPKLYNREKHIAVSNW